ncbi:MAG: prepilin-type N-terminal cleavage/methylation domain-containing protein [Chthoniobacterales bacterium]|nr:prepilin-type N-terminal cleavage/methylation domain-containing protein [Chthoniobacterales bacterium]
MSSRHSNSVSPTPPPSSGRCSGFSLIELLVVIAILSILVTVGMSTLSQPKQGREISAAGGVLGDLAALAREHALSKNTRTVLVVAQVGSGPEARSVASIWDAATTNQLERWNALPGSVVATNSGAAAQAFSWAKYQNQPVSNPDAYWFYPDGRMGDDANALFKLKVQPRNGAPDACELIFNPVTGTFKTSRGGV